MSKSKRPSFANNLLISTPKQSSIDTSTPQKAIPGLFMNVEIDKIDFFDKNPRKHHDPEIYEQIKASIRASGVQQPVHITQRPNSDRYVLAQGGNTRLSIVKELYAETNDSRFAAIPCIFVEYTNETDIQIAHLIENEQRQEMCFWDKAQAYAEVREIFQRTLNKEMSQREMVTVFSSHGLSISRTLLVNFFFAADNLQALGNLAQYLSSPKTAEIRKSYSQLKKQINDADFDEWWHKALADFATTHNEKMDFDADVLCDYLEQSFNASFDVQNQDNLFENNDDTGSLNIEQEQAKKLSYQEVSGSLNDENGETETSQSNHQDSSSAVQNDDICPTHSGRPTHSGSDDEADAPLDTTPDVETTITEFITENTPSIQNTPMSDNDRLHQKIRQLLSLVHLEDCFYESDLFPLGFYVEYPDFEALKDAPFADSVVVYLIDRVHQDAGDVLDLLIKLSHQERYLMEMDGANAAQNPILSLPDDSRIKKSALDSDYLDKITCYYVGDRSFLTNKLIYWLSYADDEIGATVRDIFLCISKK